jgi:hypothetical protein
MPRIRALLHCLRMCGVVHVGEWFMLGHVSCRAVVGCIYMTALQCCGWIYCVSRCCSAPRVRALLKPSLQLRMVRTCFCAVHDGTLPTTCQFQQCSGFVYCASLQCAT